MNIYLDIDGVLLDKDLKPANYVDEFLAHITSKYPTHWLTTHCKGDAAYTMQWISKYFSATTLGIVKKILPTNWQTNKTEAIDFTTPFLWFDDVLFLGEQQTLKKHNAFDRWIKVDLKANGDHLKTFLGV